MLFLLYSTRFSPKRTIALVSSNLQFCVSIRALNIRIHQSSQRRKFFCSGYDQTSSTSNATTIEPEHRICLGRITGMEILAYSAQKLIPTTPTNPNHSKWTEPSSSFRLQKFFGSKISRRRGLVGIVNSGIHTGPFTGVECELRESTLKTKHHVLQQFTNSN